MSLNRKQITFSVLNLVQGLLIGSLALFVPSRAAAVNWTTAAAAILIVLAAPALLFGGRWGRIFALSACLVHGLIGTLGAVLVAGSASYLLGIYGHYGRTIGVLGFVLTVLLLVVFWLIPAHEIHYLSTKRSEP